MKLSTCGLIRFFLWVPLRPASESVQAKQRSEEIDERLKVHLAPENELKANTRQVEKKIENLWDKYAVTMKQILAERDRAAAQLSEFLVELRYK